MNQNDLFSALLAAALDGAKHRTEVLQQRIMILERFGSRGIVFPALHKFTPDQSGSGNDAFGPAAKIRAMLDECAKLEQLAIHIEEVKRRQMDAEMRAAAAHFAEMFRKATEAERANP